MVNAERAQVSPVMSTSGVAELTETGAAPYDMYSWATLMASSYSQTVLKSLGAKQPNSRFSKGTAATEGAIGVARARLENAARVARNNEVCMVIRVVIGWLASSP